MRDCLASWFPWSPRQIVWAMRRISCPYTHPQALSEPHHPVFWPKSAHFCWKRTLLVPKLGLEVCGSPWGNYSCRYYSELRMHHCVSLSYASFGCATRSIGIAAGFRHRSPSLRSSAPNHSWRCHCQSHPPLSCPSLCRYSLLIRSLTPRWASWDSLWWLA